METYTIYLEDDEFKAGELYGILCTLLRKNGDMTLLDVKKIIENYFITIHGVEYKEDDNERWVPFNGSRGVRVIKSFNSWRVEIDTYRGGGVIL